MAVMWTLIYMVIAVVFIWWVLGEARKWSEAHGGDSHGQEEHHEPRGEDVSANDDLTVISGIGEVLAPKLHRLGITTYQQIAELTPSDIARINTELDFKGRIEREGWVEQAQELLRKEGG